MCKIQTTFEKKLLVSKFILYFNIFGICLWSEKSRKNTTKLKFSWHCLEKVMNTFFRSLKMFDQKQVFFVPTGRAKLLWTCARLTIVNNKPHITRNYYSPVGLASAKSFPLLSWTPNPMALTIINNSPN